ncbi:MAG: tetratricopeptide repeat protein [Planctomycetota bacterium]|jgi:Flp pilus assembly protein TadD
MRYLSGSLILLTLLSSLAHAQGGKSITESELKPHKKRFDELLKSVQSGRRQLTEVMAELKTRADREKDTRLKAISHYLYGNALMLPGIEQNKQAREQYKKALKSWSRFPAVYGRLAVLAAGDRNLSAAHAYIDKALALDPDYCEALTFKAQLYAGEGKYADAERLFKRSWDVDPQPNCCAGLAQLFVLRYKKTFNDQEKARFAKSADYWAKMFLALDTKSGEGHLLRAAVLAEIGREEAAIKFLEKAYGSRIPEAQKVRCLERLAMLYLMGRDIAKAVHAYKRMLDHPEFVKGKMRDHIEKRIKDLEDKGELAGTVWEVERLITIIENDGITPMERRDALRRLIGFLNEPGLWKKEFADLAERGFRTMVLSLRRAPPEMIVEIFGFFQENRDPNILPVLVHFVYPADDGKRTPRVRLEAVRTISAVGGAAMLPTLYYCLRDEPGEVVRAVESDLARLCEERSMVGGGLDPLTPKQRKLARTRWREFFTSEIGGEKMAEAIDALSKIVESNAAFNRSQKSKPMADHMIWTVLLDDDMPWATWTKGYAFIVKYLGREFRPVAKRDTPVVPDDRAGIVKELEAFMGGRNAGLPPPSKPAETEKQGK